MPYQPDQEAASIAVNAAPLTKKPATSPAKFRLVPRRPKAKPHSATRKNCPQNEKTFKKCRLPNGSHVAFFSVPGQDDKAQRFKSFQEDSVPDLVSTQRFSFTAPVKRSTGNTKRYGCNEQPWALPTIAQHDLGLSTNSYEQSLQLRAGMGRTVRTAPAQLALRSGRDMEEDVATITSSDPTAMNAMLAYYAEASRLEQTVLAQMFKRVSAEIQVARTASAAMLDDEPSFPTRPATQQQRSMSRSGKKPAWKF